MQAQYQQLTICCTVGASHSDAGLYKGYGVILQKCGHYHAADSMEAQVRERDREIGGERGSRK